MSKVLLDTNILVYSKDTSSVFHDASKKMFFNSDEHFITSKNLSEYYCVVTKGENSLLTPQEALNDLTEFVVHCKILYPNQYSYQKLIELLKTHRLKGLKVHDFEIASIALANGINKIVTFNKPDFRTISELEVIVPN